MSNNKIMVAISAGDWEGVQHRPHHFMKRAAKSGRKVIYMEPPVTLIAPLKNRALLKSWGRWKQGVRKMAENLYVISPPPILPFGNKYRFINKINQKLIARSLRKALRSFNGELELYSFLPSAVDLLDDINFKNIYYDCVDDHASFTGFINKETMESMERELMEKADVCFATASQLLEDRKSWSSEFHLIPNGAEFEHFSRVQTEKLPIPTDILNIHHPIVGFVGGISDWINLKLIEEAAKELPDYSFVMIGPVDTDIEGLKKLKNVYFLGAKSYNELPNYIQCFDMCLIPFKINKLTKSVNPIKMYEYFSSGKPVIATPMQEVVLFKDIVEIVEDKEQMVQAITNIAENKDKYYSNEAINERQKIGEANSWDSRWEKAVSFMK
ncbi:glycosyltransferase [Bacillus sp. AGMB 02131]|uniref:Glycosyltransferase n=1 Tax=Peribacillus faecalis TaxID=2772559 RepID=A0A927CVF0_9BACI|nr:glycosyltransferase [Peribacillus faecalis]MBD3108527.1 glycosyltransferase [Peribacillus faecalis]